MGSSISVEFTADVESPSGDGLKSVVSDPIENDAFVPAKFWDAQEKYAKTRSAFIWEQAYKCETRPDGSLVPVSTYAPPGMAPFSIYTQLHLNRSSNELLTHVYGPDASMTRCQATSHLKIHSDPTRFEFWTEEHGGRRHGPVAALTMQAYLDKMGTTAKAAGDSPSIMTPGELSIVSGPIEDCSVTADTFFDWAEATLIEAGAAKQQDGRYKDTQKSWIGPPTTRLHKIDPAAGMVISEEFGMDETCTDLKTTFYTKVHDKPFRLESWVIAPKARRSDAGQKELIAGAVKEVIKVME